MKEDKKGLLVKILIAINILLVLTLLYIFVAQPALTGYVTNAQNQGFQKAVVTIAQRAAQCEQVPLTVGNQTINIVAVECVQQALQQQSP